MWYLEDDSRTRYGHYKSTIKGYYIQLLLWVKKNDFLSSLNIDKMHKLSNKLKKYFFAYNSEIEISILFRVTNALFFNGLNKYYGYLFKLTL